MADAQKKDEAKEKALAAVAAAEAGEPAGGGKKKLLLIIIGAVVALLALGGSAAFFLMSSGDEHEQPTGEHGVPVHGEAPNSDAQAAAGHGEKKEDHDGKKTGEHEGKEKEKAAAQPEAKSETKAEGAIGESYSFKPFHLNLGNPLDNHYVRLEISVEYLGGELQKQEMEKRLPQLRDAIVSVTSRKSREFLLGPDGKDQLRRELLIRINRYMSKPVEAVYITDILIE